MSDEQTRLICMQAYLIATGYSSTYGEQIPRKWEEWGDSSRADFWSSAQDDLDIHEDQQIPYETDEEVLYVDGLMKKIYSEEVSFYYKKTK